MSRLNFAFFLILWLPAAYHNSYAQNFSRDSLRESKKLLYILFDGSEKFYSKDSTEITYKPKLTLPDGRKASVIFQAHLTDTVSISLSHFSLISVKKVWDLLYLEKRQFDKKYVPVIIEINRSKGEIFIVKSKLICSFCIPED